MSSNLRRIAVKSAGGSQRKSSRSPVTGWTKPSVAACSIRRSAAIGCAAVAQEVADVDRLADQRMAGLGQVDADLVRASGLEAHAAERGAAQPPLGGDVGDRVLPLVAVARRAADAVAAIGDQVGFDAAARDVALGDRQVLARGLVALEDRVQPALARARVFAKQSRPDVSLSMRCTT